jgi:hypothetical protein
MMEDAVEVDAFKYHTRPSRISSAQQIEKKQGYHINTHRKKNSRENRMRRKGEKNHNHNILPPIVDIIRNTLE